MNNEVERSQTEIEYYRGNQKPQPKKVKVCKYCRSEIDAKAKVCPHFKKSKAPAAAL